MHVQLAELALFDRDRAKAFYIDICRRRSTQGKDSRRWIELRFAGAQTALPFLRRWDEAPSTEPFLVFVDDDVETTVERLKSRGVEIVSEPQNAPSQPGRTVAEFRDSNGNRIVIGSR